MKIISKTEDYMDGILKSVFRDSGFVWDRRITEGEQELPDLGVTIRRGCVLQEIDRHLNCHTKPAILSTTGSKLLGPRPMSCGYIRGPRIDWSLGLVIVNYQVFPCLQCSEPDPNLNLWYHPNTYRKFSYAYTLDAALAALLDVYPVDLYSRENIAEFFEAWSNLDTLSTQHRNIARLQQQLRAPVISSFYYDRDSKKVWNKATKTEEVYEHAHVYTATIQEKHTLFFNDDTNLRVLHFHQVMDSYTAAQEVYKFFCNLAQDKPVPVAPDDIKIAAHGFDRHSFRSSKRKATR